MEVIQQYEREVWRIVLSRCNASEFLLSVDDSHFALPAVDIPCQCRVAENLNAEIALRWDWKVVSLFSVVPPPNVTAHSRFRYHAVEPVDSGDPPPCGMRWVSASLLTNASFANAEDFAAVREIADRPTRAGQARTNEPFGKPDWFANLCDWTQETIRPRGLHLTGGFTQLNASRTFSLIRFETNGPAVWFKAVGAPNLREFPITIVLSKALAPYIPKLLGTRSDWSGWLTEEAEGANLANATDFSLWMRATRTLVEMQIHSIPEVSLLLDGGAHDVRISTLTRLVDPLFQTIAELMKQQTRTPPPALSNRELEHVSLADKRALDELSSLAIPDALGHLDLNPGNIIVSADRCVFLDWAEACVGNPFLTFEYLLEHLCRARPNIPDEEASLVKLYAHQWIGTAPQDDVTTSLALSPLLAVFAYAATVCTSSST